MLFFITHLYLVAHTRAAFVNKVRIEITFHVDHKCDELLCKSEVLRTERMSLKSRKVAEIGICKTKTFHAHFHSFIDRRTYGIEIVSFHARQHNIISNTHVAYCYAKNAMASK